MITFEKQIVLLEALARFKYLTTKQLQLIFGLKSNSYTNTIIRNLKSRKHPLIKSIEFGIIPWIGRLAKVHFLSQSGVRFLIQELGYSEDWIQYPKNRNSFFQRDYYHRIATIDFNISFQKWLASNNYLFTLFYPYFNRSKGSNYKRSMTSVSEWNKWVEPDWVGIYTAHNKSHIFLFEQHNGKDKQRAIRQMINHCYFLAKGTYSDHHHLKTATKIYYVFEFDSCKLAVMEEFNNHSWLMHFKDYFLFKSQQELAIHFNHNWHKPAWQIESFLFTNQHE